MLLAARSIEADFYARIQVYMWTGVALASIGLLVWAILRIRDWFFDSDESEVAAEEMITHFRQLKREGELSDEEFRLISQRLSATSDSAGGPGSSSQKPQALDKTDVDESTDVEED